MVKKKPGMGIREKGERKKKRTWMDQKKNKNLRISLLLHLEIASLVLSFFSPLFVFIKNKQIKEIFKIFKNVNK